MTDFAKAVAANLGVEQSVRCWQTLAPKLELKNRLSVYSQLSFPRANKKRKMRRHKAVETTQIEYASYVKLSGNSLDM